MNATQMQRTAWSLACNAIALVFATFFFISYRNILTTEHILTASELSVAKDVILPIISFGLTFYFVTIGIITRLFRSVSVLFGLIFLWVTGSVTLPALFGAAIVAAGFFVYIFSFQKTIVIFKQPSTFKTAVVSISLTLLMISAGVTVTFYSAYANNERRENISVNSQVAQKLSQSLLNISLQGIAHPDQMTVADYAAQVIGDRGEAVTAEAVSDEEATIQQQFGIRVSATDKIGTVVTLAVNNQIRELVRSYRAQLGIIIPLAFFFITQVFSTFASGVAFGLLSLSELLIQRMHWRDKYHALISELSLAKVVKK